MSDGFISAGVASVAICVCVGVREGGGEAVVPNDCSLPARFQPSQQLPDHRGTTGTPAHLSAPFFPLFIFVFPLSRLLTFLS